MKKELIMKTAILIPGTKGLYSGIYETSKKAAKGRALVTSDFGKIKRMLKEHLLSKVLIVMGAKKRSTGNINAYDVYLDFMAINKKVKYIVLDSWQWTKVPNMIILPGKNMIETISGQL